MTNPKVETPAANEMGAMADVMRRLPLSRRRACVAVAASFCLGLGLGALAPRLSLALSRKPPAVGSVEVASKEQPTSVFEGLELFGEDADGTVWQVEAARGWGRESERSGVLEQVEASLQKGNRRLLLTAGEAEVDRGDGFRLAKEVVIRGRRFEIHAAEATYLHGQGRITADGEVQFQARGLKLSGKGVEVELASQVVRIAEAARAEFEGSRP